VGTQTILNTQPFIVNAPTTLSNLVSATSSSANPALAGLLRLASGDSINWRNTLNTNDFVLAHFPASGNVPESMYVQNQASPGAEGFLAGAFIANGLTTTVAASGVLRLHSGDTINWRNGLNGADLPLSVIPASGNYPADTLSYVNSDGTKGIMSGFWAQNGAVANIAAGGAIRLHSGDTVNWRKADNTADITLSKNASDQLQFNGVVVGDVSSFRATWGGVAFGMANLGAVAAFIPDKAITVTSYGYSLPPGQGLGTGCSTQPVLRVTDGSVIGPSLTVANSNGQGSLNTSLNFPALDNTLRIEISFASAGCATQWGNVNLWVQYRMQ
jgi:hypothetical protein